VVYVTAAIYCFPGSLAKLSLLSFYLRLAPQKWFKYSVYAVIAIIGTYTPAIFFSLLFACNPIPRGWDPTITEGSCINQPALYIATAVANIVTDLMLLVLPVRLVIGLQMKRMQKIGLIVVFAIGSV
jgi:hypothetical protein